MHELKNKQLLSPRWLGLYLLFLALFLRVGYVATLEIDTPIRTDSAKYVAIAVNLLKHGVYSYDTTENPQPNSLITPGYPLFLTPFLFLTKNINATYHATIMFQAILGAITVLLAYMISLRLLPAYLAFIIGLLAAISPHFIVTGGYLLSETLFTFLLVLSTYLLISTIEKPTKSKFLIYGLLMGFAALVRPVGLLLPFFTLVPLIFVKDFKIKIRTSVLYTAIGVITFWLPWQTWSPMYAPEATNAEKVFAFGTYPDFTYKTPELRGYPYREDPEYSQMSSDFSYSVETLIDRTTEDPEKYITWYLIGKPLKYWNWSVVQGMGGPFVYPVKKTLYDKSFFARLTYIAMEFIHPFIVAVMFIGILYFILLFMKKRDLSTTEISYAVIATTLVYATLLHMVFVPLPRYSVPFYCFMYMCAFTFIYHFIILIKNNSHISAIFEKFKLTN